MLLSCEILKRPSGRDVVEGEGAPYIDGAIVGVESVRRLSLHTPLTAAIFSFISAPKAVREGCESTRAPSTIRRLKVTQVYFIPGLFEQNLVSDILPFVHQVHEHQRRAPFGRP